MRSYAALAVLALLGCKEKEPEGPGGELAPSVVLDVVAAPHTITLADGTSVEVFAYNGQVPGPLIEAFPGDRVVVNLENQLPSDFATTIHWHGIEGTNAMDGTPTTQASILPGETFTYDFVVPRAGVFWYHPHLRTAQTVMGGLYGPLIVSDPAEGELVDLGVLPARAETLVLSDLSVVDGEVQDVEDVDVLEEMNGTEGEHLLVNGVELPTFEVPAGSGLRLGLINTSISRFYRLSLPGHTFYRVGGEGGLLDRVVVEGGTVTGHAVAEDGTDLGPEEVDLGFARGEILLSPADRADVVVVPSGAVGEELVVSWHDYARGRHKMWLEGGEMLMDDADDDGTRPAVALFKLRIVEGEGESYAIAEGDPVLEAVGRSVAVMEPGAIDWTGELRTELFDEMEMGDDADGNHYMVNHFYIDGVAWKMEHRTAGHELPHAPSARYAVVGDTIEWEVFNASHMAHPFHLHGFSFQPVRFVKHVHDNPVRQITWDVPYAEWEDTVLLPAETAVVYRVELADPIGNGGAVGRWMEHCHIAQHAEGGMMSELIVAAE